MQRNDKQQYRLQQETSFLETGFGRYEDYIFHGDKHDALELYLSQNLPVLMKGKNHLRILDVGAGTGRLTRQLLNLFDTSGKVDEITALEPSSRAFKRFEENFRNCASRVVNLQNRPFLTGGRILDDPFDLIMAAHVCYYFKELDDFVSQVMGSLNESGHAVFVATSISILQNELYKTILPRLRNRQDLPRTFDSDGQMSFAENVECILFDQNLRFQCDILPSSITFSLDEMRQDVEFLNTEDGNGGPVLKAMAFLWRYPVSALFSERDAWLAIFQEYIDSGQPLILSYEDMVLTARR